MTWLPRHSGRGKAGAHSASREELRLWASARRGDTAAMEKVYAEHGDDLLALAWTLLGNRADAKVVVIETLADACTASDLGCREPIDGTADPDLKRRLSRLTYERCRARPIVATGTAMPEVLSWQQRAAIALCMFGAHTCDEAASVLALTAATVAELLRSGLHELAPLLEGSATSSHTQSPVGGA